MLSVPVVTFSAEKIMAAADTLPYDGSVVAHFLVTRRTMQANPALLNPAQHLSESERAILDRVFTSETGGNKPRQVILLDNHSSHPSQGLRGAAYVYNPDTLVGGSAPFNGRLFNHTMVLPLGDGIEESTIKSKMAELASKLRSVSRDPYRLARHSPAQGSQDSAPWEPAYGTHGNFVSVLREDKPYATPSYYLATHTDAGPAGEDLYEALIKPGRITYGQLLESPEYSRVKLYSLRNAKRVLSLAATTLGARHVTSEDRYACVDRSRFQAYPQQAEPQIDTEFNTFSRLQVGGQDSVVFYSQSTPLQHNTGGGVAYLIDPVGGMVLYNARPDASAGEAAWTNGAANAFPACTGHLTNTDARNAAREALSRRQDRRRYALSVVQWEGRGNDPCSNDRLFKYASFDPQSTGSLHREALGAQYGSVHLKTVSVIVPPPAASA